MEHAVEFAKKYPDKDFVGLSINANGDAQEISIDDLINRGVPESTLAKLQKAKESNIDTVKIVSVITDAVSCDLVTEAGAGGKVLQLLESEIEAMDTEKTDIEEGGPGSGRRPGGARTDAERTAARQKKLDDSMKRRAAFVKKSNAIKQGLAARKGREITSNWAAGTQKARNAARKAAREERLSQKQSEEKDYMEDKLMDTKDQSQQFSNKEAVADHADAAQDIELIKKMIAQHGGEEDLDVNEEECAVVKEACEAYKEMGYSEEEAQKAAVHHMKLAKYLASQDEEIPEEEVETEEKKTEAEAEEKKEAAEVKESDRKSTRLNSSHRL